MHMLLQLVLVTKPRVALIAFKAAVIWTNPVAQSASMLRMGGNDMLVHIVMPGERLVAVVHAARESRLAISLGLDPLEVSHKVAPRIFASKELATGAREAPKLEYE